MPKDRKDRAKLSRRRVETLVKQGVPFNPAGASGLARETGAGQARSLREDAAAGQIRSGTPGTASTPRGGVSFTPKKRGGSGVR